MKLIELYDKPLKWDDVDTDREFHDEYETGEYEPRPALPDDYSVTKRFRTRNGQVVDIDILSNHEEDNPFKDSYNVEFDVDGELGMTGRKEAIEIFSTVLAIMKEFMDAHPETGLIFTAEGESRIKLYHRIAHKYLSSDYSVNLTPHPLFGTQFNIKKNDVSEMSINELNDNPSEWSDYHRSHESDISVHKRFHTKAGQSVDVDIEHMHRDLYSVEFDTDGSQGITGKKEAVEIFSTVLAIIKEFMNNNPDVRLFFSSSESNRTELYKRMINRYLSSDYSVEIENDTYSDMFTISKNDKSLNELFDTPPTKIDTESSYQGNQNIRFTTKNGQGVYAFIDRKDENAYELMFTVDGRIGVTGKGETAEIFSTLLDFIKKALSNLPEGAMVKFESFKASRTKLYKRMLDIRLKSPYRYSMGGSPDHAIFYITKESDDNEIN